MGLLSPSRQPPPGHLGNLTAEQESKLKEFWRALADIFESGSSDPRNGISKRFSAAEVESTTSKKKKKKSSSSSSRRESMKAKTPTTGNDKFDQTREFQKAMAQQSPGELRAAFWAHTKLEDPDAMVLRFLRARKWDVKAAMIMLISTLHWRTKDARVDEFIMPDGEEGAIQASQHPQSGDDKKAAEDFIAQVRMGKAFLHGFDKEGRLCSYIRVRQHKIGQFSAKSLERLIVWKIETARLYVDSKEPTATIVFDLTGFTLANMDYKPLQFIIKCLEANYPETLGLVIVYRAPWIFHGIWKLIRSWLDPVVAAKVHFVDSPDALQDYIPKTRMIKELGGDEDWAFQYIEPVEGENAPLRDPQVRDRIHAEREKLFRQYEDATYNYANGQDNGKGRPALARQLADSYRVLDPYVRARNVYDRADRKSSTHWELGMR